MIAGDRFCVHYSRFGSSETYESELGRFDKWAEAKDERLRIFVTFPEHIRAVWIMRINPSMNLKPQRRGEVLRRRVPQSEKNK